jgi:hypothetical protein
MTWWVAWFQATGGRLGSSEDGSVPAVLGLSDFQPFQFNPVTADLGKVVLGLLHKPAFFSAAENLR